ncbi:Uncharacterised protein [Mycobacteroides abscessus]|nr:Uncharacterised protein [Mycobacteroides abscessus]
MRSSSDVEVMMTTRTSEPTSPSRVVFVSDAVRSFCVRPMRRDTAMPRIDASVMTPRPPILMPSRMTTCPYPDQ